MLAEDELVARETAVLASEDEGDAAMLLSLSGFSTKEIAAILGTSEGSVRGLLSIARKGRNGGSKD